MNPQLHDTDELALRRLVAVNPEWTGIDLAGTLTGCDINVLLHAGPTFEDASKITRPILNSARVAAVYEGLASSFSEAENKILDGEIQLKAAQRYRKEMLVNQFDELFTPNSQV